MSIPNYSLTQNELAAAKREQDEGLKRQRAEQSLEQGLDALEKDLEGVPSSAPSNRAQPQPIPLDQTQK